MHRWHERTAGASEFMKFAHTLQSRDLRAQAVLHTALIRLAFGGAGYRNL